ncbi:MAG: HAMP domain-containing protein [Spirochaetes bacterium]|nr:HAMP domain-containing protein [Spirochaetota bacterium]
MNLIDMIYLNSFSLGSFIAVVFFFMATFFLMAVKNKSQASRQLGIAYLWMGIFNIGYLISATIYHPLAAYHRWLTIFTILAAEASFVTFFFYFPDEKAPRVGKVVLYAGYAIATICTVAFAVVSLKAGKVYFFSGHYWDFDADAISKTIGLVIIGFIVFGLMLCLWRTITHKGRERWTVLVFGLIFIVSTIAPAVLNTMSRDGLIARETFNNSWVLFNVVGFFILLVYYINNTKDRISFMGKLIGISLVTFLAMLQIISYFLLLEKDESFDGLKEKSATLVLDYNHPGEDAKYVAAFIPKKNEFKFISGAGTVNMEGRSAEFQNALIWYRIRALPRQNFVANLNRILNATPAHFKGYAAALKAYAATIPETEKTPARNLLHYADSLKNDITYSASKISQIPDGGFHSQASVFAMKKREKIVPFYDAMEELLMDTALDGAELKREVLDLFTLMRSPSSRHYRIGADGLTHYIGYMQVDSASGVVSEAGFPYIDYRAYMHPTVLKFVIILLITLVIVRFGFQFFFLGILINPLRALSQGVREVDEGNLDIEIPVKIEDEIGHITRTFNGMVATLRTIVETITGNTVEVKSISGSLNEASESLGEIAKELTAIVEEAAASYEEMSSSFESSLENSRIQLESSDSMKDDISEINKKSEQLTGRISRITDRINEAVKEVEIGEQTVNKSVKSIEELAQYLHNIEGTINAINDVADKINLLALNAAIEASRAGEHGRGFAVVADEVNKLADQTSELAKGIQGTIIRHAEQITSELDFIGNTSKIFMDVRVKVIETRDVLSETLDFTNDLGVMNTDMREKINRLSEISNGIYSFSMEQKNVIDELTRAVNTISELSQSTLENAEMVRGYARIVDYGANDLANNIESFKKKNEGDKGAGDKDPDTEIKG